MPTAHRERHYAAPPKMITFTLEPRSRSAGTGVHVVPEITITIGRNTHIGYRYAARHPPESGISGLE